MDFGGFRFLENGSLWSAGILTVILKTPNIYMYYKNLETQTIDLPNGGFTFFKLILVTTVKHFIKK